MYALSTIQEFLDNPMGKGSNAIMSRKLIYDDLKHRYDKLLERKNNQFNVQVMKDKTDYYVMVTVPSETERTNTYDVVVQFTPPETNGELVAKEGSLKNYHIKLFSNSPSFTYTYAYAFNQYGLMTDHLKKKFDGSVLNEAPTTRNPSEIIGYEKSTVFALLHILHLQLLPKAKIDKMAKKFDKDLLVKTIRNDDKIRIEIKLAEKELRDKRKAEKAEYDRKAGLANKARTNVTQSTKSSTGLSRGKIQPRSASKEKIGARPKRTKR